MAVPSTRAKAKSKEDRARFSSKLAAGPVKDKKTGRRSFPVPDAAHVKKAKQAIGRAPPGERPGIKRKINKAAKKFGLPPIGGSKNGSKK